MRKEKNCIVNYQEINSHTVAMLAGNPLVFNDLINISKQDLTYNQIKKEIFLNFKKKRESLIKDQVFDIFGIDKEYFLEILKMPQLNPALQKIISHTAEISLETGILLIGFQDGQAQITEINEVIINDLRSVNFHAIGSGNAQATNALLFQRYSKEDDLKTTLYNIYKAKRNAEVLVGVGKETDLLILKKDSCSKIDAKTMRILKEIYEEEQNLGKNHEKILNLKISDICRNGEKCTSPD